MARKYWMAAPLTEIIAKWWSVAGHLIDDGHLAEAEALFEAIKDLEDLLYEQVIAKRRG